MINEKYTVIDAHCHIYPEKIVDRAVAGTDAFYGTRAACRGVASELVAFSKTLGIDHFVIQSVATTPKQVASINSFIASAVAENSALFTGLGAAHPDCEDQVAVIEQIKALGLHGIKIHPDIQGFAIDDERMLPVYALCQDAQLPILMHTGDHRYNFSNPDRLLPILKAFPRLTVIGAHFGGWSVWDEAAEKLSGYPNFYVDTSSTFCDISAEKVSGLIDKYTADKVLFGTDYPLGDCGKEIALLEKAVDSQVSLKKILYGNAAKIFGLTDKFI